MRPQTLAVVLTAIAASLLPPAVCSGRMVESGLTIRQEVSNEWRELWELQRQVAAFRQTLQVEHEELCSLAKQKHAPLDLAKYREFIRQAGQLQATDKQLLDPLRAAAQARDETKQKQLVAAMAAHEKEKLAFMQAAEKVLSADIERLKRLPSRL